MSKPENDPRYVSSDRVNKLAFLFRRNIARRLQKTPGQIDTLAATISCALRGDDDTNGASRSCIDMLTMWFHPDKQQRREAAQHWLDEMEFGLDSEIKQAEFLGNFDGAERLRREKCKTRMNLENDFGKLQQRVTIDGQQAPVSKKLSNLLES